MKLRSARLQPLQHLASKREEQAAQRVADAQRLVLEREHKLHELESYLADYGKSLPSFGGSAMLLNRQAFIGRLREAVNFQARSVEQARAGVETERHKWLATRRRVQVLEQLARVYRGHEQLQHERQNQKHMDEFAARRFVAASGGGDGYG